MTPTSKKCPEHNGHRPGKQLARRVVFVAYFGRIWDLLSWFLLAIGIESKSSSIKKLESTVDGISLARSWLNLKRLNELEYMHWLKNRIPTYFWEKVVRLVHSCHGHYQTVGLAERCDAHERTYMAKSHITCTKWLHTTILQHTTKASSPKLYFSLQVLSVVCHCVTQSTGDCLRAEEWIEMFAILPFNLQNNMNKR